MNADSTQYEHELRLEQSKVLSEFPSRILSALDMLPARGINDYQARFEEVCCADAVALKQRILGLIFQLRRKLNSVDTSGAATADEKLVRLHQKIIQYTPGIGIQGLGNIRIEFLKWREEYWVYDPGLSR